MGRGEKNFLCGDYILSFRSRPYEQHFTYVLSWKSSVLKMSSCITHFRLYFFYKLNWYATTWTQYLEVIG